MPQAAAAKMERFPDEAAWLEGRLSGVGASESAAVFGISPFQSELELYAEKVGLIRGQAITSEPMEWGLRLEGEILKAYQEKGGYPVRRAPRHTLWRSQLYPWLTASFDGFAEHPTLGTGPAQIKNVGWWRLDEWDEEPPLYYTLQVMHEIVVAGAEWGALVALIGGQRFKSYEILVDPKLATAIVEQTGAFWERVRSQSPPPLGNTVASAALLAALYPAEIPGKVVTLPPEAEAWDAELQQAKADKKDAEEREARLKSIFKATIQDGEVGIIRPGLAYTLKHVHRSSYTVPEADYRELRRKADKAPKA